MAQQQSVPPPRREIVVSLEDRQLALVELTAAGPLRRLQTSPPSPPEPLPAWKSCPSSRPSFCLRPEEMHRRCQGSRVESIEVKGGTEGGIRVPAHTVVSELTREGLPVGSGIRNIPMAWGRGSKFQPQRFVRVLPRL